MPDRIPRLLRLACIVLCIGLVARIALVLARPNPVAHLRIPELPTLQKPGATNAVDTGKASVANPIPATSRATNAAGGTNASARPAGTNVLAAPTPPAATRPVPPGAGFPGPAFPGMPGGGRGGPSLDPTVQARLDKIIQSELLGPVPRPLPMALLGIAGTNVFLRTPSGQSGMLGEGGELGGIKLLRIGINRILVDEGGTNKELTIFGGAGGQSLLPQPTAKP